MSTVDFSCVEIKFKIFSTAVWNSRMAWEFCWCRTRRPTRAPPRSTWMLVSQFYSSNHYGDVILLVFVWVGQVIRLSISGSLMCNCVIALHSHVLAVFILFFPGHLMDNWELPGTAHFCEHMLFLGTDKVIIRAESRVANFLCSDFIGTFETRIGRISCLIELFSILYSVWCSHPHLPLVQYPSENEYSKFISSNGGSTNAYTSTDNTNYHFDVKPSELPVCTSVTFLDLINKCIMQYFSI